MKLLHGQQLSKKLIELDHEISPSIQDIDKSIKSWNDDLEAHKSIKPLLTFSFSNDIRKDKNRRFNARVEGIESNIRELIATKYISKNQGIYSYIEYDKTSPNAENMILSKFFKRDNRNESDIYVIASEGGKLKPNFKEGIFNNISRSLETTLSDIIKYLNKRGYTRIVIIDYSCNKGNYNGEKVPRNVIIDTRKRYKSIGSRTIGKTIGRSRIKTRKDRIKTSRIKTSE